MITAPRVRIWALAVTLAVGLGAPSARADGPVLDPTFGNGGLVESDLGVGGSALRDVAVQSDGKVVGVGTDGDRRFVVTRFAADGQLDPSFASDGKVALLPLPDGQSIRDYDPQLDTPGGARAEALQQDGKIVVAGLAGDGTRVMRLTADGQLDSSFSGDGLDEFAAGGRLGASGVAIDPDGKILVVGAGPDREAGGFAVTRYNEDGNPDSSFGVDGSRVISGGLPETPFWSIAVAPQGKIVVSAQQLVRGQSDDVTRVETTRLTSTGVLDTSFGGTGTVLQTLSAGLDDVPDDVAVQPDGRIIVAATGDGPAIMRYTTAGALDPSFSGDGMQTNGAFDARRLLIQPDGEILVAGHEPPNFSGNTNVSRLHPDGTFDESFAPFAGVSSRLACGCALALDGSGRILVAGEALSPSRVGIERYSDVGDLDTSFGSSGTATASFAGGFDDAMSTLLQPDGDIIVAGQAPADEYGNPLWGEFAVARYTPDGALDTTFASGRGVRSGYVGAAQAAALAPNGEIYAVGPGENEGITLIRYTASGAFDPSFSSPGLYSDGKTITRYQGAVPYATAVVVQPDGRPVIAGLVSDGSVDNGGLSVNLALARLTTSGAPDSTFASDGQELTTVTEPDDDQRQQTRLLLQPDGKIVATTSATIARFDADGSPDPEFSGDGEASNPQRSTIDAATLTPQGQIVVAGESRSGGLTVTRYNADGSLDRGFSDDGSATIPTVDVSGPVARIFVDRSGRILLVARATRSTTAVVRVLADGSPDRTFGDDAVAMLPSVPAAAADEQGDDQIVIAGTMARDFGLARFSVQAASSDGSAPSQTPAQSTPNLSTSATAPSSLLVGQTPATYAPDRPRPASAGRASAVGSLRVSRSTTTSQAGIVRLTLSCDEASGCAGLATLRAVGGHARAATGMVLGRARYSISAHERALLRVKLKRTGLRLLRLHGPLAAVVMLSPTRSSTPAADTRVTLRVHAAAHRDRH